MHQGRLNIARRGGLCSVLAVEFGQRRFAAGLGGESLFDLSGVFGDRLTAAVGILRWPRDGTLLTREDCRGVEDPGANR